MHVSRNLQFGREIIHIVCQDAVVGICLLFQSVPLIMLVMNTQLKDESSQRKRLERIRYMSCLGP